MNLASIIDGHQPDDVAIISRNQSTTYRELVELAGRARGGLSRLGVQQGDRVALVCANGRPFVASYLGILGIGAVAVPLNPTSPANELQRQLRVVGAKVAIVDRSAAASWAGVDRASLPALETVISVDGAGLADAVVAADMLDTSPVPMVDVADDHLAVLMFTSGTAGSPRAAMLTHRNLLSNLEQIATTVDRVGAHDVVYGVVPLFHIFGLNVVLGMGLYMGATVLLVQRFDPVTALESIRARGVTVVPGAPAMWLAFSHLDDAPADAFAGVRLASSGAAKLAVSAIERMRERFGVDIGEGYGLTEASPVVTSSSGIASRPGSVGVVLAGIEMRIVDDEGHDALVGDAGEIWLRGPNVFAGYLDDPEATARVLTDDGWLRTGDIGYCDDDGYVYLVDRAKDLVIVSGFNVFPAEVEEVLAEAPGVVDVGVVGIPHPHTGEAVKAFVVLAEGAELDEEALIDYVGDHLARYKVPSKILVVDELPRNANGKLLRSSLV